MRLIAGQVVANAVANTQKQGRNPLREKLTRLLYWGFVVSILLTIFENPALNTVSSVSAVLFLFLLLSISFKQYIFQPMIWLLLITSIASGFSGVHLDRSLDENRELCQYMLGEQCIENTIEGYYIFGFPTREISRSAAVREGKLNQLNFGDHVRGYGLISLARVTVIGS